MIVRDKDMRNADFAKKIAKNLMACDAGDEIVISISDTQQYNRAASAVTMATDMAFKSFTQGDRRIIKRIK